MTKDIDEAQRLYRKAADQGLPGAEYNLGVMFDNGNGVPRDSEEALRWYNKAAEQGYSLAQYNLGNLYLNGNGVARDGVEALKWLHKAADQGFVPAQYNIGLIYDDGLGVPKNGAEALKWYELAAAQGSADAENNLGIMFSTGNGVPKDSAKGFKWYHDGAIRGNATAQDNLGKLYAIGNGVAKDEVEGLAWINIAAASGNEATIKDRTILEIRLGRELTLAAQQRSREILKGIGEATTASRPSNQDQSVPSVARSDSPKASGSGAIVSSDGLVLTAAHVVQGATSIKVCTAQGVHPATIVQIDEANDIAVLRLDSGTYSALPIGLARKVRLGQTVSTIGFPNIEIQGFSPKVTRGEISSSNGVGDDPRSWQISVPVQPGNSGGPLLDENGNLVGVVVSKLGLEAAKATNDLPQNVSYAVKSTYALALLDTYLDGKSTEPVYGASPRFEDMISRAQQSAVLILVY